MVKVLIETPYSLTDIEHGNFMDMLGEMNRDNSYEYKIYICRPINDKDEPIRDESRR